MQIEKTKKSKKVLILGIASFIPIIIFLGIWLILNLTIGWESDGAGMFSLGVLMLASLIVGPIILCFGIQGIVFGVKRIKMEKSKDDIIGLVMCCGSLLILSGYIVFWIIAILS